MLISMLAASLAAAGGVAALTVAVGRGGRSEVLNTSIGELQKDLRTSRTMARQLVGEKTELARSLTIANATAEEIKRDLDETHVQLRRLQTMHEHYNRLLKDMRDQNEGLHNEFAKIAARGIPVAEIPRFTGRDALMKENQWLRDEITRHPTRSAPVPTTGPKGVDGKP